MTDTNMNQTELQTAEELNELLRIRREKMNAIAEKGIEPFGRQYDVTHHAADIIEQFDSLEGQTVRLAGRVMAVRGHGKASFAHMTDLSPFVPMKAAYFPSGENLAP